MITQRLALLLLATFLLAPRPAPSSAAPGRPSPVPEALATAARALAAGDTESALAALAALPPELPEPMQQWAGEADLLRGVALLRAGLAAEAVRPLERAAARLPTLADLARAQRAAALRQAGDPAAAALAYDALLRDFPDSPWGAEAAAALGGARAEAGDLAGSVVADRTYLAGSPDPALADSVRLRLGGTLEALGRPSEAVAVYRALVVERPVSVAAEEAAARLERLASAGVAVPPLTQQERLTRGLILFDAYRSAEALRDLEAVDLTSLPGGEWGGRAQEVRLKRGLALFRLRRYPEAARALAPLAAFTSAAGEEARFWRARALARQGRPLEAVAEFTALAETNPGGRFAGQAAYLAAVVLDDTGKTAEALARLRDLAGRAGRSPVAADALWQISWSRYRAGDLAAAGEAFDELMRRFPGTDVADRALYWQARTELKLGQVEPGLARLRDLVARRPLSYYGIQAARRIEEYEPEAAASGARGPLDAPVPLAPGPLRPVPEPACCRIVPPQAPLAGLERAARLVELGLLPEARAELSVVLRRRADVPLVEAARLLHAAGDYARPLAIARGVAGIPLERLGLDPERRLFPLAFPRGYAATVEAEARAARVPVHLAYAIIRAESLFDPEAVSPVGARGLMQLMPATAADLAPSLGAAAAFDVDLLFKPDANIRFGMTLLGRLLARFRGRPHLAIAAYNAGAEAVTRWLAERGRLPDDEFIESIPYTETRNYVMKVLAFWRTYDALYGAESGEKP